MARSNGMRNLKQVPSQIIKTKHEVRLQNKIRGSYVGVHNKKKKIPKSFRGITHVTQGDVITYLLDTNVVMNTYDAILNFKEHRVCIASQVWRELDKHKAGKSDGAMNARRAIRLIEAVTAQKDAQQLIEGVSIPLRIEGFDVPMECTSKIIFDFSSPQVPDQCAVELDINHPDDRIIMVCLARKARGEHVVLVSNDGNCRVKARMCGVESEEYLGDTVVRVRGEEDTHVGYHVIPPGAESVFGSNNIKKETARAEIKVVFDHDLLKEVHPNEFLIVGDEMYRVLRKIKRTSVEAEVVDRGKRIWGVKPRNPEQIMALDLLVNRRIPAVSIAGLAGSGKTFLTLAAALALVKDEKVYDRIIITRPTAPSGEDIGFLPGSEEEKMSPWMGAIDDNLELLCGSGGYTDCDKADTKTKKRITLDFVRSVINIKSLNFMKGRTLHRTFVIVDESQDLTPRQLKMIATRVGEGSKIVFLGNVAQIDNNYLTEHTCGISVFIRAFADSPLVGHITLHGGIRSPFATLAEERL